MISEIYYSPVYIGVSKQLNLLDFSFKNSNIQCLKSVLSKNSELKENKLVKFIERTYYYVKIAINKYSNAFSNHLYSQHALFTILAMKIYTKSTYREIIDFIDVSDIIKKYLRIKKVPHFTTIQKFFKRLPSKQIREINHLILSLNDIKADIIALDGSGFTNDYADKYYAKIRQKERKSYIKNHLTIDVKTRLILYYQTSRGPKYDTQFAKPALRQIKKYKPYYIVADKAYDTEPIRKCINEELKAFDQIPLKNRAKKGQYRLKSPTIFRNKIYTKRNNIESIFSTIKRKFNGTNHSRSTQLSNKETKLKNTIYNIYRTTQIN
jgi:transposase